MINTLYGTYTRTIIFWEESRYRQMSRAIKLHLIMQGHWVVLSLRAGWHVGQGHLCLLELFGLVPFFVVSFCRQRSTVARGNRSPTRTPTTRDPSDAVIFFNMLCLNILCLQHKMCQKSKHLQLSCFSLDP